MSRPPQNPKRGLASSPPMKSARLPSYHNPNPNKHQHKKPRFDPRNPSTLLAEDTRSGDTLDDEVLDLDEIGTGGRRVKRGAVRIEGYESDSSNEGYERKVETDDRCLPGATKGTAEGRPPGHHKFLPDEGSGGDDDDMFGGGDGDEDDEDVVAAGKVAPVKQKKEVRFLNVEEIEGQESDNDAEHVHISHPDTIESDSDEDDAEAIVAEDASKLDPELGLGSLKKHAPKLEAFNMKSEMEEGRFDANGNFIRNAADVDAVHDSWLEGLSRKEMKKAKEAHEKREEEMRRKARAEDELLTSDMLITLIMGMETGETVLEALARLGQERKKKVALVEKEVGAKDGSAGVKKIPRWKQNKRIVSGEGAMEVEGAHLTPEEENLQRLDKHYKELIEKLTGAADILLTRGQLEIYDDTREMLMRQYKRETGEDWSPPALPRALEAEVPGNSSRAREGVSGGEVQWEYRWTDGPDAGVVYGPFSSEHMEAWNEHGYFGDGVEFRKVGVDAAWTLVADFD